MDGSDGIRIYISPDVWRRLKPGTRRLLVAIQDYGRFWLELESGLPDS